MARNGVRTSRKVASAASQALRKSRSKRKGQRVKTHRRHTPR